MLIDKDKKYLNNTMKKKVGRKKNKKQKKYSEKKLID